MTLMQELSLFGITSTQLFFGGGILVLKAVVRVVPGRRLVCRAEWMGKEVYVKIFLGRNAQKYALRDELGVQALWQNRILTPKLIFSGKDQEYGFSLLVFEAVQAQNAEDFFLQSSIARRASSAVKLMAVIGQQHNANLIQTDLYLKNFLVAGNHIYTLDGDGIRQYKALSRKLALKNLAVLISKFDVLEVERWLPKLLETYAAARNWPSVPDLVSFKRLVNQHRTLVASHYADKKVFRQCTDVNIYRQSRLFEAVSSGFSSEQLPISIHACNRLIEEGISLKKGNTCTVSLAEIDGIRTVLKRYNVKGFWHGLNRAFRQTRAAASWANAYRLHILGIATPRPIAFIEQRFGFLRGKAYFLSEYIDAPDASTFFAQIKNKKSQAEAIQNIVEMFYRMYLLKLSHGDMKSNNIKVLDGAPYLIDLDSMQQHAWDFLARKRHAKDLKRFMRNWQEQPTLYNTFVKAFFAVYADSQVLRLAGLSVD
jgi:tRNA A-37 threonylcarbamoyl transferase component Bud32